MSPSHRQAVKHDFGTVQSSDKCEPTMTLRVHGSGQKLAYIDLRHIGG